MTDTTFNQGTIITKEWLQDANDHVNDKAGTKHTASKISNTPSGGISSTDVQAAINELDGDIFTINSTLGTLSGDIATLEGSAQKENFFINGSFKVARRPTATPSSSWRFGSVDRWAYSAGNISLSGGTITQDTSVNDYTLAVNSVTFSAANTHNFRTRLEAKDTNALNSKTITVSAVVFQNTGASLNFNWKINKANGVDSVATGSNVTVPHNTWTAVTTTFTLGASDANNGLEFVLASAATPGAVSSHSCQIKQAQLVLGSSISSTFVPKSYEEELNSCLRYWTKSFLEGVDPGTPDLSGCLSGRQVIENESSYYHLRSNFAVPMRAIPTITWYNPINGAAGSFHDGAAGANRTINSTNRTSIFSTGYPYITPGAGTAGNPNYVHYVADAEL